MIAAFLQLLWLPAFVDIDCRGGGHIRDRSHSSRSLVQSGLKSTLVQERPLTSPWDLDSALLRLRVSVAPA